SKLRRETFGATNEIALHDLRLHGKRIDVRLQLPAASEKDGYYAVERIVLNGKGVAGSIRLADLADSNRIEITLGKLVAGQQDIRRVNATPHEAAS
ncbi:hypothetical protein, partial [Acinetobacter baumannii]